MHPHSTYGQIVHRAVVRWRVLGPQDRTQTLSDRLAPRVDGEGTHVSHPTVDNTNIISARLTRAGAELITRLQHFLRPVAHACRLL